MKRGWLWGVVAMLLVACAQTQDVRNPRLVREVTLPPPTEPLPTRLLSPTPVPRTPEAPSLLQVVTVDAAFVLVTPTLPPSKTPTQTPTFTQTPTATVTPTITATATMTAFLLPTSNILPITGVVAQSANRICDSNWFFIQPRPPSCPLSSPNATNGVYQTFQNGYMIWVLSQSAIYVFYNDPVVPRWQVFRDFFQDGMPETSPEFDNAPAPNLWQPRRGFGMLWRNNSLVRDRLGWATIRDEVPYSVQVQTASDGSIFISAPNQMLFGLLPNNVGWQLYSTAAQYPGGSDGFVPLPTIVGGQ